MYSSAVISDDGLYRYSLIRTWNEELPILPWIMLNPSKADHTVNDPTVLECIRLARRWDFGGIIVKNLFGFRATKPKDMMKVLDPVGPKNDEHLIKLRDTNNIIVVAWGSKGVHKGRDQEVLRLLRSGTSTGLPKLKCLGKTHAGCPSHPLGAIGPDKLIDFDF